MIAAWMLYCTLCAAALAGAALFAERALLGSGASLRSVWIAAILLSFAVPAVAYRTASRPTPPLAVPIARPNALVESAIDRAIAVPSIVAGNAHAMPSTWNWRATMTAITRANRVLVVAWLTLSAALALYFLVGVVALARMRRRWPRQNVLGFSVLVSDKTGPAVVGAVSPAIVMPAWALDMETSQLELMLRHEEEHRRAKDAQLMTIAQLVLILMPWNAALWWLTVRLGMAVELDCDARVLRDADARSYGDLLLEVARPRTGPRLIGATAFAERAEQLERRIRAITRRRMRASRGARAVAALAGFGVVSVAWVAPRPPVPPRATSKVVAPIAHIEQTNPASTIDTKSPTIVAEPGTDVAKRVEIPPVRVVAAEPMSGLGPVVSNVRIPAATPTTIQASPLVDSVFARLFAGIPLSIDQVVKAHDIIAKLEVRQIAQDVEAVVSVLRAEPIATAMQAQRDSALRAMVTNDADRERLNSNLAKADVGVPAGGGRRGRSGGGAPPSDPNALGGGRGGGMPGRGRVGGPTFVGSAQFSVASVEDQYRRLFDGITLTPEQEAGARAILDAATEKFLAALPELPMTELRLANAGRVSMRAESRDSLAALLTNDADRALLESRAVVETRTIIKRGMSQTPP